ncbi:ABC transporter substrate-binding protein [Lachnotalea glycerini]|nr:ABC transporter substrate-binding protein [Lachnotalea glycerini]
MKKKILSLLLVTVLTATMFMGCGTKNQSSEQSTSQDTTSQDTGDEQASQETAHIVMTYLTAGNTPADLLKVQDAVNEITKEKINVEVEFKAISIPETFSQFSLWITSGEQIDLMMNAFQGVSNYVNSASLEPLDLLITENAPTISKLMEEYPITDGTVVNDEIYGISPVLYNYGAQGSLLIQKDVLDEIGVTVKDQYQLNDFTEIFAAIKEKHPDMYPYGIIGTDVSAATAYGYFGIADTLGATANSGVLMGTDSTKIVNLYETEDYYNYLKTVREWYEAGYIMPDAATTDSLKTELLSTGVICSFPMLNKPEMIPDSETQYGKEFVALVTTDNYYTSLSPNSGTYWTIPITSKNPDAAMKFLNLMYEDSDLANLIHWGIEGTHYVKTDTEKLITFPEGVTADTSGYYNTLGLYGDRRYEYTWSDATSEEANETFTQKSMSNKSKAVGYSYNSENMTNQLIAINSVMSQYLPSLETGSVDLDSVYPEFISALKNAGIEDVIADNQAQFDLWLEKQ